MRIARRLLALACTPALTMVGLLSPATGLAAVNAKPVAKVVPKPAPSAPGEVFNGDFETGDLTQWDAVGFPQRHAPDRIRIVKAPTDGSRYAARFETRPGDNAGSAPGTRHNRTELGCTYFNTACVPPGPEQVGDDRYYGWSTLFPKAEFPIFNPLRRFEGHKWQLIMQLGRSGSTPPISVGVVGDQLALVSTDLTGRFTYLYRAPLQRDNWYRFVLRVFHSPDAKTGFVQFWVDGKEVTPKTHVVTMRQALRGEAVATGGKPVPNTPKLGLYRSVDTPVTQAVYHDNFVVGTSRATVDPTVRLGR